MYNPSYPSSSNDPPFTTIKLAYRRACLALSRLWSRVKRIFLVNHRITPTTPNLNSITRVRFITASPGIRSRGRHELDCLPLYVNAIEIEMQNNHQPKTTALGKTAIGLTFQAVVALGLTLQNSSSSTLDHPHLVTLQVVQCVMVIAFALSFGGSFLRHVYPRLSNAFENIGSVAAAVGLCLMTSFFLSGCFTWVSLLACAFCILAFIISFT